MKTEETYTLFEPESGYGVRCSIVLKFLETPLFKGVFKIKSKSDFNKILRIMKLKVEYTYH
ncbi:hypothetical protein GCM10022395_33820 [Snuella lapsa]|uniref:Uncharacterized protein n=1 Tax=Snuella lapsa TaxID=870481 RepID=A0ABP6YFX0_9FLAO